MTTILKTEYDIKHYQNCLAYNLQLIEDLKNTDRLTIKKEAWEAPSITFWRNGKQLTSNMMDSYPRTKSAKIRKARSVLAHTIKELEAINSHIIEELDKAQPNEKVVKA